MTKIIPVVIVAILSCSAQVNTVQNTVKQSNHIFGDPNRQWKDISQDISECSDTAVLIDWSFDEMGRDMFVVVNEGPAVAQNGQIEICITNTSDKDLYFVDSYVLYSEFQFLTCDDGRYDERRLPIGDDLGQWCTDMLKAKKTMIFHSGVRPCRYNLNVTAPQEVRMQFRNYKTNVFEVIVKS